MMKKDDILFSDAEIVPKNISWLQAMVLATVVFEQPRDRCQTTLRIM
jgi:hypothetical protein